MNNGYKYDEINDVKIAIAKYLKNNGYKMSDITSTVHDIKRSCIIVSLKNGKNVYFPIKRTNTNKKPKYKLTPKGAVVLGLVGATLVGTLATRMFKTNGDDVELSNEESIALAFEEGQNQQVDYSGADIKYVSQDEQSDFKFVNDKDLSNAFHSDIHVKGSAFPNQASYDYVMNNFYDSIEKYGNMYGVDSAIIASLIMVECGGPKYYEASQTNLKAFGLGQFKVADYQGVEYIATNVNTGEKEKVVFDYKEMVNNPDLQVKMIAVVLQQYLTNYYGNTVAALIAQNQGVGTVAKLIEKAKQETGAISKSDVLRDLDPAILSIINHFKYGDPEYVNKAMTYINYILENKAFGKDVFVITTADGQLYVCTVDTDIKINSEKSR